MAQRPNVTILVAIGITLRIRESKVQNLDPPDLRRFVLSEHSFLVFCMLLVFTILAWCCTVYVVILCLSFRHKSLFY